MTLPQPYCVAFSFEVFVRVSTVLQVSGHAGFIVAAAHIATQLVQLRK